MYIFTDSKTLTTTKYENLSDAKVELARIAEERDNLEVTNDGMDTIVHGRDCESGPRIMTLEEYEELIGE